MLKFRKLFPKKNSVIGMIHLKPLPGSPLFDGNIERIVSTACKEAETYLNYNIDGLLIENMHDVPYIKSEYFGPEITATMSRVCTEVKKLLPDKIPCGIQILASGNKEALAIAKACNLNFIRAEGFVFGHVADEGYIDANAGQILRYRKFIDANDVLIFADIKKKHSSHSITSDVSLVETAKAAEFFLADGLILTGTATGCPANENELTELKKSTNLPIIIGSGITSDNVENYLDANAFIIGSYFKKDNLWYNEIDSQKLVHFFNKFEKYNSIYC